jgi:acetyl-CoA synthetase
MDTILPDPNLDWALPDYSEARASFSWEKARRGLDGLPRGAGLNIAHETVDRHAAGPRAGHVAIRWVDRDGSLREYTYAELRSLTSRFAKALGSLGVQPGDRVFAVTGRIPELYIAALGALKLRAVFCPLFSAYGPEPLRTRLALGEARVLVTTERIYRRKLRQLRDGVPTLEHVLTVRPDRPAAEPAGAGGETLNFHELLAAEDERFRIPPTDPEDPALLHFTSGTTGTPKGVIHVHEAVLGHYATGRLVLDLRPEDTYWCTADPGWVTGVSYGIIAPLAVGATLIVDLAEFDGERWYGLLQDQGVTVWYTAPTAVRMLMRLGTEAARRYDLSSLRVAASVGEPLSADEVTWGLDAIGTAFHDTWWQTETGSIMIANPAGQEPRPGSMGRPVPGIDAAIVRRTAGGPPEILEEPNCTGELALRTGWPSMFRDYLDDEERYRECFADGWYLSGDLARRDDDGFYWFVSRSDDVIKSAGHLIGPLEVEDALRRHPAVAEIGVAGRPDPVAGQVVKAWVALGSGYEPSEDLKLELLGFARRQLGPVVAPKEIEFMNALPRTESGKIVRRLLGETPQ